MSSVIASSVAEHHPGPQTQERGQRAVFCGLTSIIWLHRRIQDAFFLVVGSRTCAHLIQSAAGVMIFAEPRFATAILGERDLAGMADCHEELDRVVGELIARRSGINRLFLVGSCPSEVIKLDLETAAAKLQVKHENRVRISAFSGSGIETTFTQGEDQCLKSTIAELPALEASKENLIVLGTVSDIVEDQFRRLFDELDIKDVHFYPGRKAGDLPAVGKGTRVIAAQPFVGETARALIARGAELISAPFPLGAEGSKAWFASVAQAYGVDSERTEQVLELPYQRAKRAVSVHRPKLEGKRIHFLPDSQLEIPMARFLSEECGLGINEVGTPFHDQLVMQAELARLPKDVPMVEGQDLDPALARVRASRPDLTVCGMGIANALESEGLRTKWSIELVFSPVQGFDQAGDLAGLFAKPLAREEILEVGSWS
ncbi:MAG: ferredoxin:protochlorophyllide reductase (ATP-dependent) subunit N [Luminiphilus sp.]|jgi:light-independent protochlorophyllide reductase subunit N